MYRWPMFWWFFVLSARSASASDANCTYASPLARPAQAPQGSRGGRNGAGGARTQASRRGRARTAALADVRGHHLKVLKESYQVLVSSRVRQAAQPRCRGLHRRRAGLLLPAVDVCHCNQAPGPPALPLVVP